MDWTSGAGSTVVVVAVVVRDDDENDPALDEEAEAEAEVECEADVELLNDMGCEGDGPYMPGLDPNADGAAPSGNVKAIAIAVFPTGTSL